MQLVIAEKPSVARDLARVLGMRGAGKHAIEGSGRVITWCIGHLVELEEPAAYEPAWKAWRLDTLPMLPAAFKLRPVPGTRDQLRAVRELLRDRRFNEVVNACDAGREGELIFRYVYELAGSRLPIKRLWISSLTDEAIRAGFAGLRPGSELDALASAARCRSEADWLVGMNATRAVTVSSRAAAPRPRAPRPPGPPRRGQRAHSDSPLYSIGRVQTPTLAILVRRELEIRQFRPRDYWEVRGVFVPVGTSAEATEKVTATWGVALPDGKAIRSRLGERALADGVVARGESAAGGPHGPVVERLRQKRVREPPPLLFDLTSLQRTANRRYGLSATATLAAAQALYERYKILTYPRTDSRHLTSDMAKELPKLFGALAALPDYAPFAAPLLADAARALAPRVRRRQGERPPRHRPDGQARAPRRAAPGRAAHLRSGGAALSRGVPPRRGVRAHRRRDPRGSAGDRAARRRRTAGRRRRRTAGRRDVRDGVAAAARSLPRARSGAARRRLAGGRGARTVRAGRAAEGERAKRGEAADGEGGADAATARGGAAPGRQARGRDQADAPAAPPHGGDVAGRDGVGGTRHLRRRAARRHARFGPGHARHARRDDRDADPADLRGPRREEPRAHGHGHRAHRRPAGEEPGLARADRELGGAPVAHGARRGDARRVHGGHLALRERRRDRDPRRRRRRAGAGRGDARPRTRHPDPRRRTRRSRRAQSPRRPEAHPPPPRSPARSANRARSWRENAAGAATAGARAARS